MSTRTAARLAWTMWTLSIGLTVLSLWLLILNLSHPNIPVYRYWAEDTLLAVGYSTVGAVAASYRPWNPVGWVLCSIGLVWGVAHFTSEYATYALLAEPGSLPAAEVAAWIYSWVWVPGLGFLVFLPLLFPNGRLPSPRWSPFAWFSVLLAGTGTIMAALSPGPGVGLSIRNPFGMESLPNLSEQLQALMFVLIFVAAASLIVRLHHARGVERQQIKWVAYAGALGGGASLPTYTVFEAVDIPWLQMVGYVPALIGIVGFPTAVGIAITRYRLYDIDILINRTLVYGSLTAMLIGLYFGAIVVLQRLFVATTGEGSTLAVVASTLVIAALFNPLRRRIQSFIDRRFYRRKYDARKTLETFSAQLRDETDLKTLSDDLVGVVRETMQPAHVSLWLCPDPEAKDGRGEDPQPHD
jgi:cytochrome b subunit of formate dehydrogenase